MDFTVPAVNSTLDETSRKLIERLDLQKHAEGGYFRRTYESRRQIRTSEEAVRPIMTSIYYLIPKDVKISTFVVQKSDIITFFHVGSPVTMVMVDQKGNVTYSRLGNDVLNGEQPQITTLSGVWKALMCEEDNFALISESVGPGFDYEDMTFITEDDLKQHVPKQADELRKFVRKN